MKRLSLRGFTIIELLVVVSIISLLMGIMLPALGKARDQAKVTQSRSNLRQLAIAHASYASEHNDRQLTFVNDNIARHGDNAAAAFGSFRYENGRAHPSMKFGADFDGVLWDSQNDENLPQPIVFPSLGHGCAEGYGAFRLYNVRAFNQYVGGRFYDPTFVAPKDVAVLDAVGGAFDNPAEFDGRYMRSCDDEVPTQTPCGTRYATVSMPKVTPTSYCLSPAAMFNPVVMKPVGWSNPWALPSGFRSPSMSDARYPSLKTHMLEHNWLQDRKASFNRAMECSLYEGGEPYYFNHGSESVPLTLFYDGHVDGLSVREAMKADARMRGQTGNDLHGLWKRDTPFGSRTLGHGEGGYYGNYAYDDIADTSFHILTTDGIRGRDTLAK